MAKVIITKALFREIKKQFSTSEARVILDLLESVGKQPRKGKALGHVGGIIIKEVKYNKFRFYFITDGHQLKFGSADELAVLLIKFVKMSSKKDQQKTINLIKDILKSLGTDGF